MSDWDSSLEGLARQIVGRVTLPHFVGGGIVNIEPTHVRAVEGILRAKLLPIFLAGEDLRSGIYTGTEKLLRDQAWDAAKEALKESK